MPTSAQQREVLDAIIQERRRCARVIAREIERLGGKAGPAVGHPDRRAWEILCDRLERISRPYRVRLAERRRLVPGRFRKTCGICGGEDHTRRRCPSVLGESRP